MTLKTFFFTLFTSMLIISCTNHSEKIINKKHFDEEDLEREGFDENEERYKQLFEDFKDPNLGYVPTNVLYAATEYTKQLKNNISVMTEGLVWQERGPKYDSVDGGNWRGSSGNEAYTSGRVNTIMVDVSDATGNTVFTGGVTGGIWKTTNFYSQHPQWIPINDFAGNMSVSSLCQNPANPDIMYMATGEPWSNQGALNGNGVYKSVNHGATWTLITSTTAYTRNFKIICDASGNVYLANRGNGLLRSKDGGLTWLAISPSGTSTSCADIEISSTGRLHVAMGFAGGSIYHRYTDVPATVTTTTWNNSTGFKSSTANSYRAILATKGNIIYALTVDGTSRRVDSCYKSIDGGVNWQKMNLATSLSSVASTQGWINVTLAISPDNDNDIYMGGLDLYNSTDGGATITQSAYWVSQTPYVHADHHFMIWKKINGTNKLIIGGDGGIFLSTDDGNTFKDRNESLNIKQFYSCTIHPNKTNFFLAGAQDNGSHRLQNSGLSYSDEVTGGDGCFCHIDQLNPQFQFTSYVYNSYFRSIDNGVSFNDANVNSTGGSFVNANDYDSYNKKLFANNGIGGILRWENPTTGTFATDTTTMFTLSAMSGKTPTAFTVSPYSQIGKGKTKLYIGTTGGGLYRLDGADSVSPANANSKLVSIGAASFPNATLKSIAIGSNENNITVTFSNIGINNVWTTTNGGTTWTTQDGNLPDMPVLWALYHPTLDSKMILATEAGIFVTGLLNGTSTIWSPSPEFPLVRTTMLKLRKSDNTVLASTYGRGLWTANILSVLPLKKIVLNGKLNGNNIASLNWEVVGSSNKNRILLEQSVDGIHFTKLQEFVNTTNSYNHTIDAEKMYYRIAAFEPNTNVVYSNVILIKSHKAEEKFHISLSPNPLQNIGKLVIKSLITGKYNWTITNVQGNTLLTGNGMITANNIEAVNINTTKLGNGIYVLRVEMNRYTEVLSFIK